MTAAARLWRRAPLWRLLAGATLCFGTLTILYPPPFLQTALRRLDAPSPAASTDAQGIGTRPDMTPSDRSVEPIAGRVLPLPAGDWHQIMAGRFERDSEINEMVLARFRHGTLTGLIDVLASTGPATARSEMPAECNDPTNYSSHDRPSRSEVGRECWVVRSVLIPAVTGGRHTIPFAALDRLRATGVTLPASMTRASWFRTAGHEFMTVIIDLPGTSPARVESWMAGWAGLLARGFDGTLKPSNVTARIDRDPAS